MNVNGAGGADVAPPKSIKLDRERQFGAMPFLLAALVAIALATPGIRFAYVFDDYDFLGRAQQPFWRDLLPYAGDMFYRPVSREIYFGLLERVSPGNPMLGHLVNLGCLAALVLLTGSIVARIGGFRAGVIASLLMAAFGQWPVTVAWVSGSQDLFAIFFVLFALHAELAGAKLEALALFALAVLSKETAIVVAPALVALPWLTGKPRREFITSAARFGSVVAAWALIHPGFRSLVAHHGVSSEGSYIGIDNPERWTTLAQAVPTILNLPLTGNPTPWPAGLTPFLAMALAPFFGALWIISRPGALTTLGEGSPTATPPWRMVVLGALLAIPPLLLTAIAVKHWTPYYVCFSAPGLAIAVAPYLAQMDIRRSATILLLSLVLGVWSRGVELEPGMPTETGLAPAGDALRTVEENFKQVAPTLPPGSIVYVSTMARGTKSVYLHLHNFQVLRVWYRDATLETLRPEVRVISSRPEYLFWVDPKLNVFQVDTKTLAVRSSGPPVERFRYRSVLRSYAIGLANSGDLQRSVDVLLNLDDPASWDHAINYRIAAMLVYASGDDASADRMLEGIPPIPLQSAFEAVANLLTVPTLPSRPLERHALRAFGLSWDDPVTIGRLMEALMKLGYKEVAGRLAQRLMILVPGDRQAMEVLRKLNAKSKPGAQIMPPIRQFELPRP